MNKSHLLLFSLLLSGPPSADNAMGSVVKRTPKEIWISADRSGHKGKGTQRDPFDGSSTAKCDKIMHRLFLQGPQNLTIRFGPGTFQFDGTLYAANSSAAWFVQSGWRIVGTGMYSTTLKMVGDFSGWYTTGAGLIGSLFRSGGYGSPRTAADNCRFADLTIDCNYDGIANTLQDGATYRTFKTTSSMPNAYTLISTGGHFTSYDVKRVVTGIYIPANTYIGAVVDANTIELSSSPTNNVHVNMSPLVANGTTVSIKNKKFILMAASVEGSNNTFERVRAINSHGSAMDHLECFTLLLGASSAGSTNNWALDSIVETPQGDYQSAFAFFGYDDRHPLTNSGLIHCRAIGYFASGLVNLAYNNGLTVDRCISDGASGVYQDTGTLDNLFVRNCMFRNINGFGVGILAVLPTPGRAISNIYITNNYCDVKNQLIGGHSYGICVRSGVSASNLMIDGNEIVKNNTGMGYAGWRAIFCSNLNGALILNNCLGSSDVMMETKATGSGVVTANNLNHNGNNSFQAAATLDVPPDRTPKSNP